MEEELNPEKPANVDGMLQTVVNIQKNITTSHESILKQIISKVIKVDFKTRAKLSENEKPSRKHISIIAIEEILNIAKSLDKGLCSYNNNIYLFNGAYWKLYEKDKFTDFLRYSLQKMGLDKFESDYYKFLTELLNQFKITANLFIPYNSTENVSINLQNGTFDIDRKSIRPFNSKDFFIYQLPFAYNPDAKAIKFQEYLDKVLPDKNLQNILLEYIAYLFLSNDRHKFEKALFLFGSGANGKSVFFDIINALLGRENTSNYSLQSLTNDTGYYRAKIADKLVNYASELGGKLNSAVFKQLVSGEPVEARLPYGDPVILTRYAKLIFNCNELPQDIETTNAFFRRLLIIPFDVTIEAKDQDNKLASRIIETELGGVFNLVLEGLNRLLDQNGFTKSSVVDKIVEDYKAQSDSVLCFLDDEGFIPSLENFIPLKVIYSEYQDYCKSSGIRAITSQQLSKRLKMKGFELARRSKGQSVLMEKKVL